MNLCQSKQLHRDNFMKTQGYRIVRIWEHKLRKIPQAALKRELEFGKGY
jgi:very-short-patch-repair endonuclease